MDKLSFESIKPRLISLGFAFYGEVSREAADPEETLLDILRLQKAETKTFKMLLAWLEMHSDLIHVERLRVLAAEFSDHELRLLGAVALKQVKNGDRRFAILVEMVEKQTRKGRPKVPTVLDSNDPYLISKHGRDEELARFGIKSAKIEPSETKKLLATEEIFRQNGWLRFRALIGTNFRADLAYVMAHKHATNPYQAAKILGCSHETAYRLWKGLKMYPEIEKLAG